jgi:glucosamine--fructose-6-phosphate aminotransferase (isomerizing)
VIMAEPGSGMARDIAEQPDAYARLLGAEHRQEIATVAAEIVRRRPRHVVLTARGTSDHAALYGAYLAEIRLGLPAGLASPSTLTLFGARPDYSRALVIGVSQSGRSPDLCEVIRVARESGAVTLGLTNEPDSALARVAELVIHLDVGVERALPATKTYTASLLALLMVVEGIRAGDGRLPAAELAVIDTLPDLAATALGDPTAVELAGRFRSAAVLLTAGRGYGYPTAREAAHKIMETSYLPVLAYSGADLLHGPLAVTNAGTPMLAIVGSGPGGAAIRPVVAKLADRGVDVVAVSGSGVDGTSAGIPVPSVDERHSPLLDILPLQRLAMTMAKDRGGNPDAPRGITKVTPTL